jgi:hypothetical protein
VEQITRVGMDTSKHIFQLHGVNAAEQPVLRRKLRRKEMVAFLAKLDPNVIAIEACCASHHWVRLLRSLDHEVKLIAPQLVKPGGGISHALLGRSHPPGRRWDGARSAVARSRQGRRSARDDA